MSESIKTAHSPKPTIRFCHLSIHPLPPADEAGGEAGLDRTPQTQDKTPIQTGYTMQAEVPGVHDYYCFIFQSAVRRNTSIASKTPIQLEACDQISNSLRTIRIQQTLPATTFPALKCVAVRLISPRHSTTLNAPVVPRTHP